MAASKPVSEIEIVNLALLQLHQGAVTSLLDENDAAAVAALRCVASTRRGLLRSHPWNFAKKRAKLNLLATPTPAFDFEAYYQLPPDCLRIIRVGTEAEPYAPSEYDIEGRYLALKDTPTTVPLTYTRDVEDVTLWDALFVEAVTKYLAVELCPAITGDRGIQRELRTRAQEFLAEAVAIDHQEAPVRVTDRDYFAEARANVEGEIPQLSVDWDSV